MSNMARKRTLYIFGALPFGSMWENFDSPTHSARSFYVEANKGETGLDRLQNMFSIDEFGNRSSELNFAVQGTYFGLVAGAIYGGLIKSRGAYENFVERNQATRFDDIHIAKRKLQDAVTTNFAKGAFQWSWRLGLFTGSYILVTTSIATYRGKSSLIEYTAAGFVTGTCFKTKLGPKAMLVGGALGGALGTVAGIFTLTLLRLTGMTMEEIRFWQYNWKKDRDRMIKQAYVLDEPSKLETMHNQRVEDEKQTEITEEKNKAS